MDSRSYPETPKERLMQVMNLPQEIVDDLPPIVRIAIPTLTAALQPMITALSEDEVLAYCGKASDLIDYIALGVEPHEAD